MERFFKVHYKRFDEKNKKKIVEEFDLQPNVLYTMEKDKVAASNPDTKHYWLKDVFTHIVSLPIDATDPMQNQHFLDSVKWQEHILGNDKDTIFTSKNYITYEGLKPAEASEDYTPEKGDIAVRAVLKVRSIDII